MVELPAPEPLEPPSEAELSAGRLFSDGWEVSVLSAGPEAVPEEGPPVSSGAIGRAPGSEEGSSGRLSLTPEEGSIGISLSRYCRTGPLTAAKTATNAPSTTAALETARTEGTRSHWGRRFPG